MESEKDLYTGLLVKRLGSSRPKFITERDLCKKIFDFEDCQVESARISRPRGSDSRFYGALFMNNCHCMYFDDYIWTIYTLVVNGKK